MNRSKRGEAEYLLYEVVRQNQCLDRDLPKTDFHKRSFLTKKELEEEGLDVPLPVYWYEHGIMVDLEEVVADFLGFDQLQYQSGMGRTATIDDEISRSDFDVSEDRRERIKEIARKIAHRYRSVFDTSVAKDETYEEFADNDFIIHLNDLRYYLETVEDVDTVAQDSYVSTDISFNDIFGQSTDVDDKVIDESTKSEILGYLDEMGGSYPREQYTHMHSLFLEWESLTRQFTYNGMLSQLNNFTSQFWNTFSRVELRIHHNENIPAMKIHRWKRQRDKHVTEFEEKIEDRKQILLENREPTNELDSVSEAYSKTVDEMFHQFQTK